MPTVIVTDPTGVDVAALDDVELDLAYGVSENRFSLTFADDAEISGRFGSSSYIYCDGTEYGGRVTTATVDSDETGSIVTWGGLTWQGMLSYKILKPDAGQDYLTVSGTVDSVLNGLFKRIGLDTVFIADENPASIDYRFDRYTDAWSGIRSMLLASSMKMRFEHRAGRVHALAANIATYGDAVDSDVIPFTATKDWRPVNHLVGLGSGELKKRAVTDWYADEKGNVSETQSLTGVDEIAAVYDYNNAELAELKDSTKKKLLEFQSSGSIAVSVPDDMSVDVGDVLAARDHTTGLEVTAPVTKKIVKISDGVLTVEYETDQDAAATSLSGSSESGGGGISYAEGAGISIDSGVISAEVTQAELDAVSAKTDKSVKDISNLSATVGANSAAVVKAQSTADSGVSAAAAAQTTADAANTAVATAQSTADAAATLANQGVTDAAKAQSTADAGVNAAAKAQSTADAAQVAADVALRNSREYIRNPSMDADLGDLDAWNKVQLSAAGAPDAPPLPYMTYGKKTGRDSHPVYTLPADEGTVYLFSIYVRADSAATLPLGFGVRIDWSTGKNWVKIVSCAAADAQTEWKHLSGYWVAPAGISELHPWLQIEGGADATGWYVTGLSIKEVTEAHAAQTTADAAEKMASTAVQTVTAAAPLTATKTGTTVALTATAATTSAAGSMSAADKAKLDGIAAGANKYALPIATTTALGGVKPDGKTVTISTDGTITAQSNAAASFLAAWPIGSIYMSSKSSNPGTTYGGTWVSLPSLGGFLWERTA